MAVEALKFGLARSSTQRDRNDLEGGGGRKETYIAPTARIIATTTFVLGFICRFHTRNTGMIANVQSVTHETAE